MLFQSRLLRQYGLVYTTQSEVTSVHDKDECTGGIKQASKANSALVLAVDMRDSTCDLWCEFSSLLLVCISSSHSSSWMIINLSVGKVVAWVFSFHF